MPYSIVHGMESMLLIKIEMLLLSVLLKCEVLEFDWLKGRYNELELINKKRLAIVDCQR